MRLITSLVISLLIMPIAHGAKKGLKKGVNVKVEITGDTFEVKSAKVKGKVQKVKGGYVIAKGSPVTVSVKSLKTGLEMRDDHMKKRLKGSKKISILQAKAKAGRGKGIIEINGVKQKFVFKYQEAGKYVKAKFDLSLKKFKIENINYMGIGVKDTIKVDAIVPVK